MSKKSKREAENKIILALWQEYIDQNPDAFREYWRLRKYIEGWRHIGRFYFSWFTDKLLPIIQENAKALNSDYPINRLVEVFREYYDND